MSDQVSETAQPVTPDPVPAVVKETKVVETIPITPVATVPIPVVSAQIESKHPGDSVLQQEVSRLQSSVTTLAIKDLVNQHQVPDSLKPLVPSQDLHQAEQFLNSDAYKAVLATVQKAESLGTDKAQLEAKLAELSSKVDSPQVVETTAVPAQPTTPNTVAPPKTWEELTYDNFAALGGVILGNL